jgi:acyl dehydratase
MSITAPQLAVDALGTTGPAVDYGVLADAIEAYSAATDDPSGDGVTATPVFAIVPVWPAIAPASRSVADDEARKRVVHYQQDMVLHRPITVGMQLVSRATPSALLSRPNGSSLVIRTETRTEDGELVNEQLVTEFFRGIDAGVSQGDGPADHRLPDDAKAAAALTEITYSIALDQTNRYADASGDRFEIHLDDEAARRVGLPGRIVHGFCTLAFTTRAVLEAAGVTDPSDVHRIAGRFSAPVFPGDDLTTRVWELSPGVYGYEASCGPDRVVIKDGRVELAR